MGIHSIAELQGDSEMNPCPITGSCTDPSLEPHHHHNLNAAVSRLACQCTTTEFERQYLVDRTSK